MVMPACALEGAGVRVKSGFQETKSNLVTCTHRDGKYRAPDALSRWDSVAVQKRGELDRLGRDAGVKSHCAVR